MSVGDGIVWNEALPDNDVQAHQIDDYDRDLRIGVRSRMAREHIWPASQTGTNEGGHHQFISFQQQTGAPSLSTALTQVGALYVGSSGDGYPLTFVNSAGTSSAIVGTTSGIMQTIYPVGGLYISTLSTNPATLLGFGTWEAFAEGRVLVGVGTSDAAYAAAATGGESTHVLTEAELPEHKHTINTVAGLGGASNTTVVSTSTEASGTRDTSTIGSGTAHNTMPPYIVVYIWKRTV